MNYLNAFTLNFLNKVYNDLHYLNSHTIKIVKHKYAIIIFYIDNNKKRTAMSYMLGIKNVNTKTQLNEIHSFLVTLLHLETWGKNYE